MNTVAGAQRVGAVSCQAEHAPKLAVVALASAAAKEEIMTTDNRWLNPWLGVLVVAALVAAIAGSVMMGTSMMGPGMMWGYGTSGIMGGWGMALGMLAMLAFWIAVIAGVVLLVRWAVGHATTPSSSTG